MQALELWFFGRATMVRAVAGDARRAGATGGFCAVRLLKWFEQRVDFIPTIGRDYKYDGEDLQGSMAYSFEIGNWHIIQLNNHPVIIAISAESCYRSRGRLGQLNNHPGIIAISGPTIRGRRGIESSTSKSP